MVPGSLGYRYNIHVPHPFKWVSNERSNAQHKKDRIFWDIFAKHYTETSA